MLETLFNYLADSGFGQFHWSNGIMIGIGILFIYLAVRKGYEPLLLIPMGFGILIGNVPYNTASLSVGVYDGPGSAADLAYYATDAGAQIHSVSFDTWERVYTPEEYKAMLKRGAHPTDLVWATAAPGAYD